MLSLKQNGTQPLAKLWYASTANKGGVCPEAVLECRALDGTIADFWSHHSDRIIDSRTGYNQRYYRYTSRTNTREDSGRKRTLP